MTNDEWAMTSSPLMVGITWTCLLCGCSVADGFRDLHAVMAHPKPADEAIEGTKEARSA